MGRQRPWLLSLSFVSLGEGTGVLCCATQVTSAPDSSVNSVRSRNLSSRPGVWAPAWGPPGLAGCKTTPEVSQCCCLVGLSQVSHSDHAYCYHPDLSHVLLWTSILSARATQLGLDPDPSSRCKPIISLPACNPASGSPLAVRITLASGIHPSPLLALSATTLVCWFLLESQALFFPTLGHLCVYPYPDPCLAGSPAWLAPSPGSYPAVMPFPQAMAAPPLPLCPIMLQFCLPSGPDQHWTWSQQVLNCSFAFQLCPTLECKAPKARILLGLVWVPGVIPT